MSINLTLVIPAHNEAESIWGTLEEIDSNVPKDLNLIVYVSEDGSIDCTREIVVKAGQEFFNCEIRLSPLSNRLGYSRGVLRGIADCRTELIAFMDSDGQCDPLDVFALLGYVKRGLVVCGYRQPRNDPKSRIVYSSLFRFAYRAFGGPMRKDPSSPVVIAYTSDIEFLKEITPQLSFGFWWEFQMRTEKKNLKVAEFPVNHRLRAAGTTQVYSLSKLPWIIWSHLIGLVKLRREISN
jgi:glycosyltransferase involved in cell wall biosynthesis